MTVAPGQFDSLLNSGSKYDKVGQTIFYKHFDLDNSISLIKGIGHISIIPRVGFQYENQRMNSWITTISDAGESRLGGDFENNIRFETTKAYFELNTQYKSKRLRMELNLPEAIRGFDIDSRVSKQSSALTRNTFEPRLFLNYVLSPFWETSAASKYNNQFGEINQLYDAYVLTTYDNLKRFNATIPESRVWENYFSLNYRDALKAFFGNIIVLDKQQYNNYLFQNMVDNKGLSTMNMLDQKNTTNTLSLNGDIGKYLGPVKTTLKAKAGLAISRSMQIINNELSPIRQKEEDLGLNVNNTLLDFLNISYDGSLRFLQGRSGSKDLEDITLQVHSFRMGIFPFTNQQFSVNIDYYVNNTASARDQVFIDLLYRLSIPRTKFNIEVTCNNLLDKNMFTNSYNSAYSSIQTSFELRPRQLMIGTWFKF